MSRIAQSKGMYVFLQMVAAFCLGSAWLVSAGLLFRSAAMFWISGLLLLGLCLACLVRTARTPYAEDCANGLNLILHGFASLLFFVSAVLYAKESGILPDMAGILETFRYDLDDGLMYAVASFGFMTAVIGLTASAMLVCMCVSVRKDAEQKQV